MTKIAVEINIMTEIKTITKIGTMITLVMMAIETMMKKTMDMMGITIMMMIMVKMETKQDYDGENRNFVYTRYELFCVVNCQTPSRSL